jgi:tetratricopeptide (TPR) repeat protein
MDVQLFGLEPAGHHLTSAGIHIATTVLLFALFNYMTGSMWRSAFVAALFGVHPVHVESVAWVAERKDVLSTFVSVLTLWAYAAYVRRPAWPRYLTVLALFALALAAKPMAVTLPLVMLLLDAWPLDRVSFAAVLAPESRSRWLRLVREKIPMLLMSVAASAATVTIQQRDGYMASLAAFPWPMRLENALLSYIRYLGKVLWPAGLAAFYPWEFSVSPWLVAFAVAVLAVVTVLTIRSRERRPYLLVGWLWYLGMLLPVIGLVQTGEQALADRFVYFPIVGLFVIAAWGIPDLRLLQGWRHRNVTLSTAAAALVVLCIGMTRVQVGYWSSDLTLWQRAVAVTDRNYLAHNLLGLAYSDRKEWDDAMAHFDRALALAPAREPAFAAFVENNRGFVLVQQRRFDEALARYAVAMRLKPNFAETERDIGTALVMQDRVAEAMPHFLKALLLKPGLADARKALADALVKQRRTREAIPQYVEALQLDPESADAHNNLGVALAMEGKPAEAQSEYEQALRIRPEFAEAENGIGAALEMQGAKDQATAHYEEAVRIDPRMATAHANLAASFARAGKAAAAMNEYRLALDLENEHPDWHYALAGLFVANGDVEKAIGHLEMALKIDPAFTAARRALASLPVR